LTKAHLTLWHAAATLKYLWTCWRRWCGYAGKRQWSSHRAARRNGCLCLNKCANRFHTKSWRCQS
jgi:hypothetical protein